MDENRPRVGVAVLIVKDGRVLVGQRQAASDNGIHTWGLAGGKLHYGESFEDCVLRETAEECGLEIANITFVSCTNNIFEEEQLHYITVFMRADWVSGDPQVLEPDKMAKWEWFDWGNLPSPLFSPLQSLVDNGYQI